MTQATHNTVIAAHGRHFMVQHGHELLHCVTRGKKSNIATGDHVRIHPTAPGQGVIEAVLPRNNLLFRSDQFKSRLLAANVDQLFIVIATEPFFSDDLVSRALVGAEAAGIDAHLILNKTDVTELLPITRERLELYKALGYPVHEVSATTAPEDSLQTLLPLITGKITLLIGQSGMGKSSLINLCVPDADITTREISTALNSGKHTTTFTRMYFRDVDTALIDSPGFQEFGLYHLSEEALTQAFREFLPYLGKCRFHNCHHLVEPGCAILEAIETGDIAAERQELYAQLRHESSQKRY